MDATSRRPSRCVQSCIIVLLVLAFLFLFSQDSGDHSFVRRDSLQQPTTTNTTTSGSITNATSSTGTLFPIASPSISEPLPSSSASPTTSSSSFSSSTTAKSASSRSSASQPPSTTSLSTSFTSSTIPPSTPTTTVNTGLTTPIYTPVTTLSISNNVLPTLAQTSSESSPSQTGISTTVGTPSSSASFWQKKGAVAATFLIVSLVVAAVGAVAIMSYLKRRSRRYQERLDDDLFEKYPTQVRRSNSAGLSINNPPMDAFASPDVGYSDSPPIQLYGVSETQGPTISVQPPDNYSAQSTPARYLAPSKSLARNGNAPPSSFHHPTKRDSYQPSIDSFYGAGSSDPRS